MSRGRQCLPRALLAAAIAGCGLRGSALLPPISPQTVPLEFPYITSEIIKSYKMNLPPTFLEMVTRDARTLRHKAEGGNYVDDKGTTWWQPKSEPRRFSVEQMIEIIAKMDFPDGMPKNIVGAEYWIQERRGDLDAGFHYDKDESAASLKQRMVFPKLSTITYLSDGGAPTMVLNQTTNQFGNTEVPAVPTEGWFSFPEKGKHMWFNGKAQHGVPGAMCQENCDQLRLVLLINWWDHTPEPPNCQRLMNKKVKELGFSRMPKEELKALKAALQPEPVPMHTAEEARTSAAVKPIYVALPPVDMLELVLPKNFEGSNGKMVHFDLTNHLDKASMIGTIDLQKRTQNVHIQYSRLPVAYAFIRNEHQKLVEAVIRPIQMALWSRGVVRQHCEIYVAFEHSARPKMHDFGLLGSPGKPAKALPAFVLHTPDGRNGPGTNTVMEETFSEQAVLAFLSAHGVPIGGAAQPGCRADFDQLAQDLIRGDETAIERAEAIETGLAADGADAKASAAYYIKTMKRVLERGKGYPEEEVARLDRMATESMAREKKAEVSMRRNILSAFVR